MVGAATRGGLEGYLIGGRNGVANPPNGSRSSDRVSWASLVVSRGGTGQGHHPSQGEGDDSRWLAMTMSHLAEEEGNGLAGGGLWLFKEPRVFCCCD